MDIVEFTHEINALAYTVWENYSTVYKCGKQPEIIITVEKNGVAGRAYRKSHKVEINIAYFLNNTQNLEETIAHEFAHIIQFRLYPNAKQAHGVEFRHIMQTYGFSGNTYHNMSKSVAKEVASQVKQSNNMAALLAAQVSTCSDF